MADDEKKQYFWEPAAGNPGGWTEERQRRVPYYKEQFVAGLVAELFAGEICQALQVAPGTIRMWRLQDKDFDEACCDAESFVTDTLEKSAIIRARDGVLEPVVSGGKLVMDPDDPSKPLMTRRYSDSLLWNLLKTRRREKYGDKQEIDLKGSLDVTGAKDQLKQKWAQAIATASAVAVADTKPE